MNKKIFFQLYLVLSFLFIIPLGFADTHNTGTNQNTGIGTTNFGQAGSALCGTPVDIRDSLVLSIVSMCLPGILDKAYEWKQIKCQTIKCSYTAVINDLDPSFCVQQEAYRMCKYIVGEMFAIPPMSVLEYYRNAIAQALANPIGFVYSAVVKQARSIMQGSCTIVDTCNAPTNPVLGSAVLLVIATDGAAIVQTLMEIFENGFSYLFPSSIDYCEDIGEIKEEMEKIVGVTSIEQ